MTAHWGIPDPAAVSGTPEEIERAFRDAFTSLDRRISLFIALPLQSLDTFALQGKSTRSGAGESLTRRSRSHQERLSAREGGVSHRGVASMHERGLEIG